MITLDSESSPFLINSSSQLGRKYLVAKRTIQIGESFQIPKVLEWNNSKEKIIEIVSNSSNEFKNRLKESVGLHLIELKENSSKYKRFGLEQLLEHINWLPFCDFEDQDELNFDQLGIPDDQFADLKISSFFPNLEKLSLKYNNLTSFATISSELNGLKKLKHLELIGNPLIFQTILKTTKKLESINSLSINSSYPFYYLKHLLFLFPNLQTLNGKSIEFLSSEKTIQLSDSIEEQLSNISPLFTHTFQNSNSETISYILNEIGFMISHQCSPNCKLTNSLKDRNYEISLTSIREIKAGDILTVNFVEGISDDQKPIHLKQYLEFCLCGSKNCFLNPKKCIVCGKYANLFCSRCKDKNKIYCSVACQKKDWKEHKKTCLVPTSK